MFEEYAGASPNFVSWKDKLHGQAPKPNHLYFSSTWPGSNNWVRGKYFEITRTKVIDFSRTFTIPGSDYKELDMSNLDTINSLNLYPANEGQVHEILIGLSLGNYVLQVDMPNGTPLGKLPDSTMIPSKTDSILKYLNAKNPGDSPISSPSFKFWTIWNMDAIILRLLTLSGVDFEKITLTFKIAKHTIEDKSIYDDNGKLINTIPWNTTYDTITSPSDERSVA